MDFSIRRPGHVVIRASDVERSCRFFVDVIGFNEVGRNDRRMYFLTSRFEDNHHMMLVRPAKPGAQATDARRRIGMAAVAYEVGSFEDLKALYGRLRENGTPIERTEDRGAEKALFVSDPDGNLFEFFCREKAAGKTQGRFAVRGSLEAELAGAGA